MTSPTQRDLYLVALRVLASFCNGDRLETGDVNAIRRNALATERELPIDELCCSVIRRSLASRRSSTRKLMSPAKVSGLGAAEVNATDRAPQNIQSPT